MKDIFILEKNLKVIGDDNRLYLLCPENYTGDKYNSDDLLLAFAFKIKKSVQGLNQSKENPEGHTVKNGIRTIPLAVGAKTWEEFLASKRRNPNIDKFKNGLVIGVLLEEEFGSFEDKRTKSKSNITNGNANKNVAVSELMRTNKGYLTKVYQLPKGIKSTERSRFNANILFNDMFDLISKETHIVVLNEVLTGGIVYMHNKDYPLNKDAHLESLLALIEKVLVRELGGQWQVKNTQIPTRTDKGGLSKFPLQITQISEASSIGLSK